ncbi:MAG: head GIN domain-containing protein [Lutibacter sp.]|nr:head GIN domain-containing protein [Lutibacter sp.]MDP3946219.1 head GIN domain-containing protein [Lutibacter sp.]
MKTLVRITILISIYLTLLFTTSSCIFDGVVGIKGNRNVVSEDRTIRSDFEIINVQQGINLTITQGKPTSISVEADENVIDLLITEVKNNELNIYFEKSVYQAKARNVYLTTENISKIKASSGASVKSENTIQAETLELDSSSGSTIKIHANANEITSESSSGSNITIVGKSNSFTANSSSGSSINAKDLKTVNALTKASSGANIDVNVTGKLTAKASSGADIDYEGSPETVDKETNSGGSVTGN